VIDSSSEITAEDKDIYNRIKHKKHIVIINKTDLAPLVSAENIRKELNVENAEIVSTSVPKNKETCISELEDTITEMFLSNTISTSDVYISGERQRSALLRAKESAENIRRSINASFMQDLLYVDLEDIISALGEITGETVQDEIIDSVFANFCVGK